MKLLTVLLVLGTVLSFCHAQSSSSFSLPGIDSQINAWLEKEKVSGLAACIVKGDKIVWANGYGWANIEKKQPFTSDKTIFNIASISKTITATAIMQLRDKGIFRLDDDVNKYLSFSVRNPNFPDKPITFRLLLTHTSSINDNDFLYSTYARGDPTITLESFVTEYFTPNGKYWKLKNYKKYGPGEKNSYANAGFALLSYLIEVLSRKPIEDYIQENIYKPLGMNETSFYISRLDKRKMALPYTYAKKQQKRLLSDGDGNLLPEGIKPKLGFNAHALYSYPTLGDGMVRTSVNQLAKFMTAYMNNGFYSGNSILKAETVKSMLTVQGKGDQGLCFFKEGSWWGHDGGDPGCSTEMLFDPKSKTGIIIFCNADTGKLKIIKNLLVNAASTIFTH